MATAVIAGLPRPSSSTGLPRMNLPVIEHPSSRLGDRSRLSIRGESRQGICRSKTFVSLDEGKLHLGLDRKNLPPLNRIAHKEEEEEVVGRSQPNEEGYDLYTFYGHQQADQNKNKKNTDVTTKYATDELEYLIAEKLTTSFHGLRHLFRSHDPTGQGNVSRPAFLRILHNLVGYITNEQYQKLLKSLDFDGVDVISFGEFVSKFMNNEAVHKEWLSPAQRKEISLVERAQYPEEILRYGEPFTFHDGYNTSAYCFAKLKEKARYGKLDFGSLLPESCLQPGGRIVPPQLKDLVEHLGMKMKEEDFVRFWGRFDLRATGTMKMSNFLKVLGLDESGKPRCYSSLGHSSRLERNYRKTPYPQKKVEGETSDESKENGSDSRVNAGPQAKLSQLARKKKALVQLDRIVDCLHYKLEEPFHSMLHGLQCFDLLGDGYIARIDFKRVLEEFKLPVQAVELENFMSRVGIRTIRGQTGYREVLNKFWNKAEGGLVYRIVTNQGHAYNRPDEDYGQSLTAEQLEAKLIEFLHGDFLKLLNMCKQADKYSLGVVTPYEFKAAVEKILGFSMTDEQWSTLKSDVKLDSDGLVPYVAFLDTFNATPGSWNHKDVNGFKVAQIAKVPTPPAVERLKQQSKECLHEIQLQQLRELEEKNSGKKVTVQLPHTEFHMEKPEPRSMAQMQEMIRELFRYRFHSFDKAFKSLDRRMTGRFNKQQCGDLLKKCAIELTYEELDNLWNSLNVPQDGILSYRALVQHFVAARHEPPPIKNKLPMDSDVDEQLDCNTPPSEEPDVTGEDTTELLQDVRRFRREKKEQRLRSEQERDDMYQRVNQHNQDANTVTKQERDQIVNKIKHQVIGNWDKLKACFRNSDQAGCATIPANNMKTILYTLQSSLSDQEIHKLLVSFDLHDDGQFHYMAFMQMYVSKQPTPRRPNQPVYDRNSHKLSEKTSTQSSWEKKLLQDWKSLRRAFRKMDVNNTGHLSISGFKQVLKNCQVHVNEDDLYHILCEFDEGLNGKISYEQFLSQLLNTYG